MMTPSALIIRPTPLLKTCESTEKELIGDASNDSVIPEFFPLPLFKYPSEGALSAAPVLARFPGPFTI